MNIKVTSLSETEVYLFQMPQNGVFDDSVSIDQLSLFDLKTFTNITLDQEWWIYFKPTNNEAADFQL